MAPKFKGKAEISRSNQKSVMREVYNLIANPKHLRALAFNPSKALPALVAVFVLEVIINLIVIHRIKYTEIDWRAYMQEVESPLNGTFNYSLIKGDTGPLVYPAGFVWIFTGLYAVTNGGENIRLAQYFFLAIFLINLALVFRIYLKTKKVPPYVLVLTCLTSYRIHSIYVLRLFNDPVAMLLLFASLNAFIDSRWSIGSLLYSLAVSVKMNILLFSPALLIAYLTCLGPKETVKQLAICAGVQIILGAPFLACDPFAYIIGSFDLGRVFLHKWTVNWRFLPESIFIDKYFHLTLLFIHVGLLGLFFKYCKISLECYAKFKLVQDEISSQLKKDSPFNMNTVSQLFLTPLFLCNFIGVTCSRSLHYQFYVWYFYTLPYLTWTTNYSTAVRLVILGVIEMCWNTYPSSYLSSILLHVAHVSILWGIYKAQVKTLHIKQATA